jgi:hypothetical protein
MTSTMTLGFVSSILHLLGDDAAALDAAERCMAIIEAHGFGHRTLDIQANLAALDGRGADMQRLGALQEALARERLTTFRRIMSGCLVASLLGAAGAPERGLEVLAALGDPATVGFYGPEIHRAEGELRRRLAPDAPDTAARCFEQALDLARRLELKSLELRAATSLARLRRDEGRPREARVALAPVYGWFTEGFDTRDLREAKALLDELGA